MTRNAYTVGRFALALTGAVMLGMGLASWRRRKPELTHAWCR